MTAVILCNGEFPRTAYPKYLIQSADLIVCCDRGYEKFLRRRSALFPGSDRDADLVIGDMDSLSPALRKRLGTKAIHETEQDHNDQTKAFRYIMKHYPDVDTIHILGATGLREDHTIGNIGLLMEYTRMFDLTGKQVDMVSDYSTIFALTDTETLDVGEGRRISIFSPDNTLKITSEGLEYPTENVTFDNWWPATLNKAVADRITLTFSHPALAVIILN